MKLKALILCLALPQAAVAQTDTRTACDFTEIENFAEWFSGSAENQKSATLDPVDASFEDFDEKGKKLPKVWEPHGHDELGWPLLPHLWELRAGWQIAFVKTDPDTVELITTGGMGYKHSYLFKREPCWTLVQFTHDRL